MNLPSVFQNKSIKFEKNQQDLFYGNKPVQERKSNVDISKKIKTIFNSKNYVYKLKVHIVTNKNNFDTTIIGKTNDHLITYDNNLINMKDIIDIYEKED